MLAALASVASQLRDHLARDRAGARVSSGPCSRVSPSSLAVAVGCARPALDTALRLPAQAAQVVDPAPGNNWSLPPEEAERLLSRAPVDSDRDGGNRAWRLRCLSKSRSPSRERRAACAGQMEGGAARPRSLEQQSAQGDRHLRRATLVPRAAKTMSCRRRRSAACRSRPTAVSRPTATETIEGTRCVLGALSLWLKHVTEPDGVYRAGPLRQ